MLEIVSPYDLSLIKKLPMHSVNDVENALKTAYALFHDQSGWIKPHKRVAILEKGKSAKPTPSNLYGFFV